MILSAPLRAVHPTNTHTGRADRPRNLLSLILRRMRQRPSWSTLPPQS
jgi:hypothetical protein